MCIEYVETTPDIQTYHGLRNSVGWQNFCIEQTEAALKDRKFFVLAKDCEKYVASLVART